jgi:hypothetical protein
LDLQAGAVLFGLLTRADGTANRRVIINVGLQALIYFGVAAGSLALAISLLYGRYVRRDPRAVRSRGGVTLFAVCLLLFALGAAAAGLISARVGR